jgi:hypothetical protein
VCQQDITLENIYVERNVRVKDSLNLIYWVIIIKNKLNRHQIKKENRQKFIYMYLVKKKREIVFICLKLETIIFIVCKIKLKADFIKQNKTKESAICVTEIVSSYINT